MPKLGLRHSVSRAASATCRACRSLTCVGAPLFGKLPSGSVAVVGLSIVVISHHLHRYGHLSASCR